jgi:ketosteroid isomerase-like protein
MTSHLTRLTFIAATLALQPAAARADVNAEIDKIYARLSEGIRAADPELSHKTYTDDAIFLPPQPVPIDRGAVFHQRMRESADRLKADGATMTVSYRRVSRQVVGHIAIDTGYYRTDMTRTKPEPATMTRYNKFLVVAARQKNGTWKITHDASLPVTKEAWEAQDQTRLP